MSANPWMEHVKKFRAKNPNLEYKECLKRAKKSYKAIGGAKKARKSKQKGGQDPEVPEEPKALDIKYKQCIKISAYNKHNVPTDSKIKEILNDGILTPPLFFSVNDQDIIINFNIVNYIAKSNTDFCSIDETDNDYTSLNNKAKSSFESKKILVNDLPEVMIVYKIKYNLSKKIIISKEEDLGTHRITNFDDILGEKKTPLDYYGKQLFDQEGDITNDSINSFMQKLLLLNSEDEIKELFKI